MRVLLVTRGFPPRGGGIGVYTRITAATMRRLCVDASVLATHPAEPSRDDVVDGVPVFFRPFRPGADGEVGSWVERQLGALPVEPDLIEVPDYGGFGVGNDHGRVVVCSLHGCVALVNRALGRHGADARRRERLEGRTVATASALLAPTRHVLRATREVIPGAVARPGYVLPHPLDLDRWPATEPASMAEPEVAVVGKLERLKGQDIAIRACAVLQRRGIRVRLVLVGPSNDAADGVPYGEYLRRLAADLGVDCLVRDELVSRRDVAGYLRRARVLLVPSRWDTFPYAAVEAMAAGRPVVCGPAVGTSEMLHDAGMGRLVTATNQPDELADALAPLLRDARYAAAVGRQLSDFVRTHCDATAATRKRLDVYAALVARPALGVPSGRCAVAAAPDGRPAPALGRAQRR